MDPLEVSTSDNNDMNSTLSTAETRNQANEAPVPEISVLTPVQLNFNNCFNTWRQNVTVNTELIPLPSLDVETSEFGREYLFREKLKQCCTLFDFVEPFSCRSWMEVKTNALEELNDFIHMRCIISQFISVELIKMFALNVFRTVKPLRFCSGCASIVDDNDTHTFSEPTWPHMKYAYDIFVLFLEQSELFPDIVLPYIDSQFITELFNLFESDDYRERDVLKIVVHRIYDQFSTLRELIRKQMSNTFCRFVYETRQHNGIAELLILLGSIVDDFESPLSSEHKHFLLNVLMPLYKPDQVYFYSKYLNYCTVQYLGKDPGMGHLIIGSLLRFWPKCVSRNELVFLNGLEDVIDVIEPDEFCMVQVPIFVKLEKCIISMHYQVVQRSLLFCNNVHLLSLINLSPDIIMPILVPVLKRSMHQKWNNKKRDLISLTLVKLENMNLDWFCKCIEKYEQEAEMECESGKMSQRTKPIENMAKSNPNSSQINKSENISNGEQIVEELTK